METRLTVFMEAMLSGNEATMRLLLHHGVLLHHGANVNAPDSSGTTPLELAYNLVPTGAEVSPQHQKFLDTLFRVLKEAGAKRRSELENG